MTKPPLSFLGLIRAIQKHELTCTTVQAHLEGLCMAENGPHCEYAFNLHLQQKELFTVVILIICVVVPQLFWGHIHFPNIGNNLLLIFERIMCPQKSCGSITRIMKINLWKIVAYDDFVGPDLEVAKASESCKRTSLFLAWNQLGEQSGKNRLMRVLDHTCRCRLSIYYPQRWGPFLVILRFWKMYFHGRQLAHPFKLLLLNPESLGVVSLLPVKVLLPYLKK